MGMRKHILAIDQGTTGTTVMIFDVAGRVRGRGYSESANTTRAPVGWSTSRKKSGV